MRCDDRFASADVHGGRGFALLAVACVALAASGGTLVAQERPTDTGEPLAGWLDERFAELWAERGIEPQFCDDATFARRVYLDLLGRIPSVSETRDFLADTSGDKYARLVDELLFGEKTELAQQLHVEHLARTWRRIMIPPGSSGAPMASQFEPWLEQQLVENVPYDELVRRMITGTGGEEAQRVASLYQAFGGTPDGAATSFTRIFLGVRIGCAQCHDHPFAEWKQKDFWGMAAFFNGGGNMQEQAAPAGKIAFEGVEYPARVLWSGEEEPPVDAEGNSRAALARWLTSAANPNFAATAVNRTWQHLLGRGLTMDVDDLDLAAPEERALLLDPLAEKFAAGGFDLRGLVAAVCKSKAYRCASVGAGEEVSASPLDGQRPLKTLSPDQLFDSLEQALMLPLSRTADDSARHNGQRAQMVSRFDESAGESPEEYVAGVPQVLMLMNGKLIADATSLETSRTLRAVVDAPFLGRSEKIETLYLAALTRKPTESERRALLQHLESRPDESQRRQAYAEIFWALLNSPEFVLCR